jgi:hypothetical protein
VGARAGQQRLLHEEEALHNLYRSRCQPDWEFRVYHSHCEPDVGFGLGTRGSGSEVWGSGLEVPIRESGLGEEEALHNLYCSRCKPDLGFEVWGLGSGSGIPVRDSGLGVRGRRGSSKPVPFALRDCVRVLGLR